MLLMKHAAITKEDHKVSKEDMLDYISRAGQLLKALQKFNMQQDKVLETEIKDCLDEIQKEGRGGSTSKYLFICFLH